MIDRLHINLKGNDIYADTVKLTESGVLQGVQLRKVSCLHKKQKGVNVFTINDDVTLEEISTPDNLSIMTSIGKYVIDWDKIRELYLEFVEKK